MRMFTNWPDWATAETALAGVLAEPEVRRVGDAMTAAARWHGAQTRPTGAPYTEHLLEALEVLVTGAEVTEPDLLAAVVLHDTVEDTPATLPEIEESFGPWVAELVDWVTKPPPAPGRGAKRAAKTAYLRRLRDAPPEAITVKLADRVSNVQTLDKMPPDFQRRYYAETITYLVPLTQGHPFFEEWFQTWRHQFRHLA